MPQKSETNHMRKGWIYGWMDVRCLTSNKLRICGVNTIFKYNLTTFMVNFRVDCTGWILMVLLCEDSRLCTLVNLNVSYVQRMHTLPHLQVRYCFYFHDLCLHINSSGPISFYCQFLSDHLDFIALFLGSWCIKFF